MRRMIRRCFSDVVSGPYLLEPQATPRQSRRPARAPIRRFHPGQHFSSKILAAYVASLHLQECRVLDMGTGSGIIGITAAARGADVIAVDINPEAAKLSARNAADHGVSANMQVLCSDLFATLCLAPKFDWIISIRLFPARRDATSGTRVECRQ
jgi:2-polyprenyl-3-methyl-5-hydroxy-6-metoxy-1,4-benzoquinol methylase